MAIEFICDHCGARYSVSMVPAGAPNEEKLQQLVSEALDLGKSAAPENGQARTAPAEAPVRSIASKPVPAKTAPTKPAVAPAPAKAPRAVEEDREPAVARKYWITLAVCIFAMSGTWWLTRAGSVPTPAEMLETALKSSDADERARAIASLCINNDPQTKALLRQLVEKATEPATKVMALQTLADRSDIESIPLFLDAMESSDKALRAIGLRSVRKLLAIPEDRDLGCTPEGAQEPCAAAARMLREQHQQSQEAARKRSAELYGK